MQASVINVLTLYVSLVLVVPVLSKVARLKITIRNVRSGGGVAGVFEIKSCEIAAITHCGTRSRALIV